MRMENLKVKRPDAKNITKIRITANSKEDAKRAADLLKKEWTHYSMKPIRPIAPQNQGAPEIFSYYVLLWNE